MKKPFFVLAAACLPLFTFNACKTMHKTVSPETELVTVMSMPASIKLGSPMTLKFTVQNPTQGALKFCKWHTPFEGFRNSFLTVTTGSGAEVQYHGMMAKRVMPPPADAYITVAPGKSETSEIDLMQAYPIDSAGTYTVRYNSAGMSGLKKVNTVTFSIVD